MKQPNFARMPLRVIATIICLNLSSCAVLDDVAVNLDRLCRPTIYTVNTTDEGTDPESLCMSGRPCTLRAAINTANLCRGGGPKIIQLEENATYTLTRADTPPSALRNITERQGVLRTALPRIFGTLTIYGLGATIALSDDAGFLKLIHVPVGGDLTVSGVTLTGGKDAHSGGAFYNEGVLTLNNSTLTRNETAYLPRRGRRGQGGAIYNLGRVMMRGGALTSNQARNGSAIFNRGSVMMTGVEISENSYSDSTIYSEGGEINMTKVMFVRNNNQDTPIVILEHGVLSIKQSTFHGNEGINAGTLGLISGEATIQSSTFFDNKGEAIDCSGSSRLKLEDVTIYRNEGREPMGIGGLMQSDYCIATISNVIVAGSSGHNCAFAIPPTMLGSNLSSDNSCTGFSHVNRDPLLGPLQNNGGPTPTLLPAAESPAINAGDGTCLSTDQRELPRNVGRCDIGAVERQQTDR